MAKPSLKIVSDIDNPNFSAAELSAFVDYPNTDIPHIYVRCRASQHRGSVHGSWIDATQEPEQIETEINRLLSTSPIPKTQDWFIQYFSGFRSVRLEPESSLTEISHIARFLAEYGHFGAELLLLHDQDTDAAEKVLDDAEFSDSTTALESLAEHFSDHAPESLPSFLRLYLQRRALEESEWVEELGELAFG